MGILQLQDPAMLSAARSRVSGTTFRLWQGALFACGAALVLDSFSAGAGWFLALSLSMGFDYMLGKSYIDARSARDRQAGGVMFIWGCTFTLLIFAGMAVVTAAAGGPSGRVFSVLMAVSSLVGVVLSHYRARAFMLITVAPAALCLVAAPLIPDQASPAPAWQGAVGVACGIFAFMLYLGRAALTNSQLLSGLEAATKAARERQIEAETKAADADAANRAKSEFLTTMTHELRTPLNAVIGYAEIIAEDMEAESRAGPAQDANRIASSARHLLGLIDQILQLSMLETGRAELEIVEFNVRHLIEDASAAIAVSAKEHGNRLATRVAADVGMARTDRGKLSLCIGHLLSNAAKFTQGGLIAVSVERETVDGREWMKIAVSDTGVGMKPEQVARAFQAFTQLDGTNTRAHGGMGLGLSFTQRTAQLLGGSVSAESEIGKGSTFTLRLPMRLGDVQASEGEKLLRKLGAAA
ncbi:two-component system sensory histidine kinase [alpha proteobacterium U9-1i]|nr:two-component system sensory histidine kinase [alpha proteobacterium U9-1i]